MSRKISIIINCLASFYLVFPTLLYAADNGTRKAGSTWSGIQSGVDTITDFTWPVVTALAAVGVLAMAIIEILKSLPYELSPCNRAYFHKTRFREMIENNIRKVNAGSNVTADKIISDVVALATAGNANALYDLPLAKLAGQVNAAYQIILAYPTRYADVIRVLVPMADPADLDLLLQGESANADGGTQKTSAEKQAYAAARTRIANLMQRNLDAIQIDWGNCWKRKLHYLSVGLSSLIIALSAYLFYSNKSAGFLDDSAADIVLWVVVAIVGGTVAPVASDAVTALKNLKKRAR